MSAITQQPPHTAVAAALQRSFRNWGLNDPTYKRTFKKLGDDAMGVCDCALSELTELSPFYYHVWWAREHMRFRHVSGEQSRLVYQLMFEFLTRYFHGKLKHDEQPSKRKKPRRTASA